MELKDKIVQIRNFHPHAIAKCGTHVDPHYITDGVEVLGVGETEDEAWNASFDQLRIKCENLLKG